MGIYAVCLGNHEAGELGRGFSGKSSFLSVIWRVVGRCHTSRHNFTYLCSAGRAVPAAGCSLAWGVLAAEGLLSTLGAVVA